MRGHAFLCSTVVTLALPLVASSPIEVRIEPSLVHIERARDGQHLNFDFAVTNRSEYPVELRMIRLIVRDAAGRMVTRRAVNTTGISPSILTIPNRALDPGATVTVFNQDLLIDRTFFDYSRMQSDFASYYGNHVVINCGSDEFLILAHLLRGSVRVKEGQTVRAGDPVGAIGMSGDTFHPHLHMELHGGLEKSAEALPMYFRSFRLWYGGRALRIRDTSIDTGDVVEPVRTTR